MRLATALPLRATLLATSLALAVVATPAAIAAQDADIDERGTALVEEFIDILKQPDAEKQAELEEFLAEELRAFDDGESTKESGYG